MERYVYSQTVNSRLRDVLTEAEDIIIRDHPGGQGWPFNFDTYGRFSELLQTTTPSLEALATEMRVKGVVTTRVGKGPSGGKPWHYLANNGLRAVLALGYVNQENIVSNRATRSYGFRQNYISSLIQETRGQLGDDHLAYVIHEPSTYAKYYNRGKTSKKRKHS